MRGGETKGGIEKEIKAKAYGREDFVFASIWSFSQNFRTPLHMASDVGYLAELSIVVLRRRQALLRHSRTRANTLLHVSSADRATVPVVPCSLLLCQRTCSA